jgi:hypothetical protein
LPWTLGCNLPALLPHGFTELAEDVAETASRALLSCATTPALRLSHRLSELPKNIAETAEPARLGLRRLSLPLSAAPHQLLE